MRVVFVRSAEHDITNAIPRAVEASRETFDEIHVVCWNRTTKKLPKSERLDGVTIDRFVWPTRSRSLVGMLALLVFQLWVFCRLLWLRPRVIQSLDFECIWPTVCAGFLLRAYCIYDMRDPFADSHGFPLFIRRCMYFLDWLAMGLCHAFVIPSEERRGYLGRWARSRRPVVVVLNICEDELPSLPSGNVVGERANGEVWLAYFGWITSTRGARILAEATGRAGGRVKLIVAGDIRDSALKDQLEGTDSVLMLGRVARKDALRLMRDADMVTLLYDPAIPVNRIAAPNKFYEALCLGTPVLVAEGMSIGQTVKDYGLGWVIDYGDPDALQRVLDDAADREKLRALRDRCRRYSVEQCSYESEMRKYRAFYQAIVAHKGRG